MKTLRDRRRLLFAPLALVLLMVGLSACGRAVDKSSAPDNRAEVAPSKIEFNGQGGKVVIGRRQLPKEFPRDLPLYPRTRVRTSVVSREDAANSILVILESRAKLPAVIKFYESKLTAAGWTITGKSVGAGAVNTILAEKDKLAASVSLSQDRSAGKTIISLSASSR